MENEKKNNLIQKVLEKIKEKKIKPEAKWKFLLKNYILWLLASLALIFGSMTFSAVLYMLKHNDWIIYLNSGKNPIKLMLLTFPYFWLILLVIFIIIINYNFRHTKKGYKYRLPIIIVVSLVINLMLGSIFYAVGIGSRIDDIAARRAPFYRQIINKRIDFWSTPNEGRLSGIISSDIANNKFQLEDLEGKLWDITANEENFINNLNAKMGEKITITGKKTDENIFTAEKIFPLGPGREWFRNNPEAKEMLRNRMEKMPKIKGEFRDREFNPPFPPANR